MLQTKWILLNIRLNDLVHKVHGSPHCSQVYSNTVTHVRPLPQHPRTVTLKQLSVVPLFSSAHQQPHRKAGALKGLRLASHRSQQAWSNNSLDYRLKRKQHSLKSSVSKVISPLVHHCSNAQQQMCRTLPPSQPTRTANKLLVSIHNSMRSRVSYLVLRQHHRSTSNAFTVILTTYTTEYKNGIQYANDDLLASRKGLVSLSCVHSWHDLNVLRYKLNNWKPMRDST